MTSEEIELNKKLKSFNYIDPENNISENDVLEKLNEEKKSLHENNNISLNENV